MTIIELEQVIRDLFFELYHKCYIGRIQIKKLNPIGYNVRMELGSSDKPTVFHAELEDTEFIKFLRQDLKARNFQLQSFGELTLRE
jgi:hypothetical protein